MKAAGSSAQELSLSLKLAPLLPPQLQRLPAFESREIQMFLGVRAPYPNPKVEKTEILLVFPAPNGRFHIQREPK